MRRAALLLAGLVLGVLPATADIFQRHSGHSLDGLGWTRAYSAPVMINGGKAETEVWNSPSGFFRTLGQLKKRARQQGWPESFTAGDAIGFGMAIDGTTLRRWLVVRIADEDDHTLVYQTSQALSEFEKGGEPPRDHRLEEVPAYDLCQPRCFLRDGNTETSFEVSESGHPPVQVRLWFDRRMQVDGWTKTLPGNGAHVYLRGRERAIVHLRPGEDGGCLITRVYKVASD